MLTRIPNALPPLSGGTSALTGKTVVAVGRLARVKGFHKLLAAWEQVTAVHPDWTLRIYGAGLQEENLAQEIHDRGLTGNAFLMGPVADVGPALQAASIFAMTSRHEGFSLTLLEAMSKGLAIVSFDSPHGPREMLTNEHDALLIKPRNPENMARGLCRVIEDEELRRRLGEAALSTVTKYDAPTIGEQWEVLLEKLLEHRRTPVQSRSNQAQATAEPTRRRETPLPANPTTSQL
jgi:glycosyltransferase involved in cell wall biosynthesis